MLGVSRITIYRLIDSRKLPVYRVGRRLKFRNVEVEEYLEAVKQKKT